MSELKEVEGEPILLTLEQQEVQDKLAASGQLFRDPAFRTNIVLADALTNFLDDVHPPLANTARVSGQSAILPPRCFRQGRQRLDHLHSIYSGAECERRARRGDETHLCISYY